LISEQEFYNAKTAKKHEKKKSLLSRFFEVNSLRPFRYFRVFRG